MYIFKKDKQLKSYSLYLPLDARLILYEAASAGKNVNKLLSHQMLTENRCGTEAKMLSERFSEKNPSAVQLRTMGSDSSTIPRLWLRCPKGI